MDILLTIPAFIGGLRGWQLVVILLLVLLVFGAGKIPGIMKNLGKGVHSFKQGLEDAKREMNKPVDKNDNDEPTRPKDK